MITIDQSRLMDIVTKEIDELSIAVVIEHSKVNLNARICSLRKENISLRK